MILSSNGTAQIKLAICTPCQDEVSAGFALDLARLAGCITRDRPDISYTIIQNRGTIIPQQRATLVQCALSYGATHLLWLDSDMRFPPETFFRLLEHGEPIVAANYSTRRPPILPTAEDRELGMLFTMKDADGLVEVSNCGMGVMLVDMRVYVRTPQPWFHIGFNPTDKAYIGEDVFFCRRAREHGFITLIDQALSQVVSHTGQMDFTAAHACVTRDVCQSRQEAVA